MSESSRLFSAAAPSEEEKKEFLAAIKKADSKFDEKDKNLLVYKIDLRYIALNSLYVQSNKLPSLDVSKNTNLEILNCGNNEIKTLDVTKNTKLTGLFVPNNKLTTLDVSKNNKLNELDICGNQFKTFDAVKANPAIKRDALLLYVDPSEIDKMPESVKAGEVLDLSKYAKCGATKSSYEAWCCNDSNNLIPETDKDYKFIFSNAYAGKEIIINITNDASYVSFSGKTKIVENPNAPKAPGKADGDIPVDDISGTITRIACHSPLNAPSPRMKSPGMSRNPAI